MSQYFSNTCVVQEVDTNYYGTGMVACYSSEYKSVRIYRTCEANAVVVENENNDYMVEETGEPLWCICCESREMATAICDALNSGVLQMPDPQKAVA